MMDYRRSLHDTAWDLPLVEICPLALLTDPQGNLLMVREKDGTYWHLLGGWLGPDESIRECLQRSVLKNCSILLESCSLLKVFSGGDLNYLSEDSAHISPVYLLFFPKRIRGSLRTKPQDQSEIRFFAPWNIPMDRVFPPMRRIIQYFVDNYSSMPIAQSADWDRYPEIVD